jgi:hypothetical protein
MPTSSYSAFDVMTESDAGVKTPVALQTIKVRDVTNATDLSDLQSDANGHVAGGTESVAAGTTLRFSADLGHGQAGFLEKVTT